MTSASTRDLQEHSTSADCRSLVGRGVFAPPTYRKRESVPVKRFGDDDRGGLGVSRIRIGIQYQACVPADCTYDSACRGDKLDTQPISPLEKSRQTRQNKQTRAKKPARARQEEKPRTDGDA
mgnify:CR=1 FL=1